MPPCTWMHARAFFMAASPAISFAVATARATVAHRRIVERGAGRVDRRARDLLARVAVGEDVLDRLEAADRPVELLAPASRTRWRAPGVRSAIAEQQPGGERRALEPQSRAMRGVGDPLAAGQRVDVEASA